MDDGVEQTRPGQEHRARSRPGPDSGSSSGSGSGVGGRLVAHLTSQFARPRGPLGALAGRIMAKRGSNRDRNLWLIDLLELQPTHRVLELGPGPGVALQRAATVVTSGELIGVDHSTTMLRQAGRRNASAMAEGRLRLLEGRAERLPPELVGFDRIYCMNVWQFWDDQDQLIADLAWRLRPGGRLAIGYQPRHQGATAADAEAGRKCLRDQLAGAGLEQVVDHRLDLDPPVTVVIGRPGRD